MSRLKHPVARWIALLVLFAGAALTTSPAHAEAVVTDCTQEELEARILEARENDGDGVVTFDCDGIIHLTNTVFLRYSAETGTNDLGWGNSITLDGTGRSITISGLAETDATNAVRLFLVDSGVSLIVTNINFFNGQATNGGAFYLGSNSSLVAVSCVFSNNIARGTNGLDGVSARTDTVVGSARNGASATSAAGVGGGAIHSLGIAWLDHCTFLTNAVIAGNGGNGGNGGSGTVRGGNGGNGGRGGAALGGAIYNQGTLTTTNCAFYFNYALGGIGGVGGTSGGGIFEGRNGNGAGGGAAAGGAIYNHLKSHATNFNTTFALNVTDSGDSASGGKADGRGKTGPGGPHSSGGAVANFGTNVLINCTFFANGANAGDGGDGAEGTVTGGRGGDGGTAWGGNIFNGKQAEMIATHCTIADGGAVGGTNGFAGAGVFAGRNGKNGASRGANIANSNGVFILKNSIVAYAEQGTNGYGKFKGNGRNISSDRSFKTTGSAITNTDPRLDTLRHNGGPVQTIELLEGSPAIDFATNTFSVETDARGIARPQGEANDLGAYESGIFLGPPRITTHPRRRTVREEGSVTFTVVAQGDAPLRYQWRKGSENIDGETFDTLSLFDLIDNDAGDYSVIVANNSGSTTSEPGTLTIAHPPVITEDLFSYDQSSGADFALSVEAEGDAPLRYEWYRNGILVQGATLSTLFVGDPQSTTTNQVIVRNQYGYAESSVAVVRVVQSPPSITLQPVNLVVAVSNAATFTVGSGGSRPQGFQWYFNVTNLIVGATNSSYRVFPARTTNEGIYHVTITHETGSVTSTNATLTVQTLKPAITTQPSSNAALAGTNVVFAVGVSGSAPFRYQWYFNTNTAVAGATNATLLLTNVQSTNQGSYRVIVTNLIGSATSAPVTLTVSNAAPLIVTNPVNAAVLTGNESLLSVFAVGQAPLSYQWFFNSLLLTNATNATLLIADVQTSNAGPYQVVVTNSLGAVTSSLTTLVLSNSAPVVTELPLQTATPDVGDTVVFTVTAAGSKPFTYQWYFFSFATDGPEAPLAGKTNASLSIEITRHTDVPLVEGIYWVEITNAIGSTSTAGNSSILDVP